MIKVQFIILLILGYTPIRSQSDGLQVQNDEAWKIRDINPDGALAISERVISAAQQSKNAVEEARAWSTKGHVFGSDGQYPLCYTAYDQALKIRMNLADSSGVAAVYNNLANFKCNEGKLDEALKASQTSINMYRNLVNASTGSLQRKYLPRLGICYLTKSKINGEYSEPDEALLSARLGVQILIQFPDQADNIALGYYTLANSFYYIYCKNEMNPDADSAMFYYNKVLLYINDDFWADWLSKLYHNYAVIEMNNKQFEQSWKNFEKSEMISTENDDFLGIFNVLSHKGLWYSNQKRYVEGLAILQTARAFQIKGVPKSDSLFFFRLLSDLSEENGQIANALLYQKIAYSLRDSILSENKNILSKKFKLAEKELEVATERTKLEKSRNETLWFRTLSGIFLALGALLFLIFSQRMKLIYLRGSLQGKEDALDELSKKLHGEVQVFVNTIAASLSKWKEKIPELSREYEMTLQINDQIRNVSHDIGTTILKHVGIGPTLEEFCDRLFDSEGDINASYKQSDFTGRLPYAQELAIFRLAHLLTDNTIKHSCATLIEMKLSQTADGIVFSYTDDGVGFDYPKAILSKNSSGLKEMHDLAKSVRAKTMVIRKEEGGMQFSFTFPNSFEKVG